MKVDILNVRAQQKDKIGCRWGGEDMIQNRMRTTHKRNVPATLLIVFLKMEHKNIHTPSLMIMSLSEEQTKDYTRLSLSFNLQTCSITL